MENNEKINDGMRWQLETSKVSLQCQFSGPQTDTIQQEVVSN